VALTPTPLAPSLDDIWSMSGIAHESFCPYLKYVTPHQRKIAAIVSSLLEWYPKNARDLPWRRTTDPYAVFVSEIMLQQTQVKTVLPYWKRWMRALPDVEALARAKPERLHKLWEGLGYYRRVRNLQRAARIIRSEHGGKFPASFEQVLSLPGVGRYTAGAICSIAFNQPTPILDGNVMRVLTRLYDIQTNPRESATNTRLWGLAEELVQRAAQAASKPLAHVSRFTFHASGSCSQFNQALMELGALVCTPRRPRCELCPLAGDCLARHRGRAEELPKLVRSQPATPRRFVAFIARNRGRFLVRRRPAGGVNAHLWEFPNVELTRNGGNPDWDDGDEVLHEAARGVLGGAPGSLEAFCTIKHSITRYRITLDVFRVPGETAASAGAGGCWLTAGELSRLPFTGAHKRILRRLSSKPARAMKE